MPKKTSKSVSKSLLKKPAVRYTAEQQRDAAESVLLIGHSVAKVARELGCSPISVNSWVAKYRDEIRPNHPESDMTDPADFAPVDSVPPTPKFVPQPAKQTGGIVRKKAVEKVPAAGSPLSKIEIVSRGGVSVKLHGDVSPDALYGIVKRFEKD